MCRVSRDWLLVTATATADLSVPEFYHNWPIYSMLAILLCKRQMRIQVEGINEFSSPRDASWDLLTSPHPFFATGPHPTPSPASPTHISLESKSLCPSIVPGTSFSKHWFLPDNIQCYYTHSAQTSLHSPLERFGSGSREGNVC